MTPAFSDPSSSVGVLLLHLRTSWYSLITPIGYVHPHRFYFYAISEPNSPVEGRPEFMQFMAKSELDRATIT